MTFEGGCTQGFFQLLPHYETTQTYVWLPVRRRYKYGGMMLQTWDDAHGNEFPPLQFFDVEEDSWPEKDCMVIKNSTAKYVDCSEKYPHLCLKCFDDNDDDDSEEESGDGASPGQCSTGEAKLLLNFQEGKRQLFLTVYRFEGKSANTNLIYLSGVRSVRKQMIRATSLMRELNFFEKRETVHVRICPDRIGRNIRGWCI